MRKQAHPEPEVMVEITTPEDRFGLRMIILIQKLDSLLQGHLAREVPVFGVVNGFLVNGIIDEIRREQVDGPRKSPKVDKSRIDHYFQSMKGQTESAFHFANFISDSKTRYNATLPAPKSTESSRYQFFLYKHLFDSFQNLDSQWETICERLKVGSRRRFSTAFTTEVALLTQGSPLQFTVGKAENLAELKRILKHYVAEVGGVEDELTLVYRLRGSGKRKRQEDASAPLLPADASVSESDESVSEVRPEDGSVIGQYSFFFYQKQLDSWIRKMTEIWTDARDPAGVPPEDVYKCRSCEYQENCEWLEHHQYKPGEQKPGQTSERWIVDREPADNDTPGEVVIHVEHPANATQATGAGAGLGNDISSVESKPFELDSQPQGSVS
ncbi:hypothetical protein BT69DRAFT_287480 [Atractiella rhizophila]|nr:hypothetical protein BT69DRAFT_287480 [Atractiella rhizophila]